MRMKNFGFAALAALALFFPAFPAHAVSKEIIQLQTQVQALQDAIQHLQTTNDERMGVLQHLVEQTADSVNKMSVTVNNLQNKLQTQSEGTGQKMDVISGQVQSLNDSVDEVKSRMGRIEKQLQDMQGQLSAPAAAPSTAPSGVSNSGGPQDNAAPSGMAGGASAAPPLQQLYQGGLRDYNSAKYELAVSEFSDVLKYYPREDLAGNAQYYMAEIDYRQGKYQAAIKGYDVVLEQYPGNPKTPAAQLRKGESLISLNQKDAGLRELRSLIQRYPQTPEAQQARTRLNALGVRITPKPTAAKEQ
jgi:tol-pal system protein YbgF